jgi:thymidine phosphorylase
MTLPQEIIRAKRDGRDLTEAEIGAFIAGLTSGAVTEGQAAAFAMAVFFNGMRLDERIALTRAMTLSGETLDWRAPDLPGPILDKHSTGGVGDNVSLMLAPMLAACGAFVPMISGRGLGHTGGTLDKLDSIPGYVTQPDLLTFKRVVREAGCAIIGQTDALAPADRRLYAIRDVTATVESVALITASILSKKLAAGLEGLVMDVKTGSGAFMPTLEGARELAESIATVATRAGLPTVSLITDMNEPLASATGAAVEVWNAVDFLAGRRRDARLQRVTLALGGELLALAGLAEDADEGTALMQRALTSGAAAERFERMVAALGGPRDFLTRADAVLPRAGVLTAAVPERRGVVTAIDVRAIGLAVVELGGGRTRAADAIDHSVGFTDLAPIGGEVGPDAPLARVHARSAEEAEAAVRRLRAAYRLGDAAPERADPVVARIAAAAGPGRRGGVSPPPIGARDAHPPK